MDSVSIISPHQGSAMSDLKTLMHICILEELSFYVKFQNDCATPDIGIFSHKPQVGEFGKKIDPHISVLITPDEDRDFVYEQFPTVYSSYSLILSISCREKQFMLPLIIKLLMAEPTWRLWNAEGYVVDVERLKRAYEEQDYAWAYIME